MKIYYLCIWPYAYVCRSWGGGRGGSQENLLRLGLEFIHIFTMGF